MQIELTSDEAYFIEKLCDDQQGLLMRDTSKLAEPFFLLSASKDKKPENEIILKAIVKKLEEEARSTMLLDRLRKKFESLRKSQ